MFNSPSKCHPAEVPPALRLRFSRLERIRAVRHSFPSAPSSVRFVVSAISAAFHRALPLSSCRLPPLRHCLPAWPTNPLSIPAATLWSRHPPSGGDNENKPYESCSHFRTILFLARKKAPRATTLACRLPKPIREPSAYIP